MTNNREQILRNLEYICGGVTTFQLIVKQKNAELYDLLDDWIEIIYTTIDLVKEDIEPCQTPSTN